MQLADTAIITNGLNVLPSVTLFGKIVPVTTELVNSLFSLLAGYINPIINMPAVISLALAMSLVPAISSSKIRDDAAGVAYKSGMGLKLALIVGLPCAVGLFLLPTPIIHLLYSRLQGQELATAGNLLAIMALAILFLTILQTMTGILQGLGKTYIPVVNLFIGIAVKIGVSLLFIRVPEINIQGAAIGTVACYTVAAVLDVAFVIKYAKIKLNLLNNFIKPILAAGVMGLVVYLMMPQKFNLNASRLMTIATIAVAVIVYVICLFVFRVMNEEDLQYIPGGKRLARLMNRKKAGRHER